MGFDIMLNFNMPYMARNLADFWRRWHISLSTWFKEYLYIPLGGSRVDRPRLALNLMVVFVVSGLWHGAATNFIVWGALHGIGLMILVLGAPVLRPLVGWIPTRIWSVLAVVITFHYVTFTFAIWQTETSLAWFGVIVEILCGLDFATADLALFAQLAATSPCRCWCST
jgi:D-alanyl-lipoteichoic acid acyltransferase DltB (MBOAT superfamily)